MKKLAFTGALSALVVAACATTGHERVAATSTELEELAASIEAVKGQVEGPAQALAEVVAKAAEDPAPSFDAFKRELATAQKSYSRASAHLDAAKKESEALFAEWTERSAAITDEGIRQDSEKRRDELRAAFDSATATAEASLAELSSFLTTAKDLETYLSQDLTPKGIEAIADRSESLEKQGQSVAESLDQAIGATRKAAPQFAMATPPPEPAKQQSPPKQQ